MNKQKAQKSAHIIQLHQYEFIQLELLLKGMHMYIY